MCSRNLQVHGGFGLEIGAESSGIQEMVHPENGIVVLLRGLGPPQPGHDQASHTTSTSLDSSFCPWTPLKPEEAALHTQPKTFLRISVSGCKGDVLKLARDE